jgi:hypothetical protein
MPDGIWGDTDADEIPDNPFHIAENTYQAMCVECYEVTKNGDSKLIIKWQIEEPESEFHEEPVTEKFSLFKKPVSQMSRTEIKQNSFLKKRLREGFDLTPDEVKHFDPKMALGKYAFIQVINTPDKQDPTVMYNNVRSALSPRLVAEQNGGITEDMNDLDV